MTKIRVKSKPTVNAGGFERVSADRMGAFTHSDDLAPLFGVSCEHMRVMLLRCLRCLPASLKDSIVECDDGSVMVAECWL